MAKHKDIGDSPFLKRVLIPFWVIRILIMVVEIAVYGLAIGVVAAARDGNEDDDDGIDSSSTTAIAVLAVVMILIIACLALDIVCIVKRARRTLSPKFFLIVNVVQTLLWTIMFILSLIGSRSGVGIAISVIILLSFVGLLIYASVIFHRHRKGALRGEYIPAVNPALSEQQGLVHNSNTADYASYPSYPSHVAYGEPPKQTQYAMEIQQPQPYAHPGQAYGYAPQTQGYTPQTEGYPAQTTQGYPAQTQGGHAPQQYGYPAQYGNVA